MNYLGGVCDTLMTLIQRDPDIFNVPPKLFEHHMYVNRLQLMVVNGLSNARGSIKAKLKESLGKRKKGVKTQPQPVSELGTSLAVPGMEIKGSHWA
ncbi:hypothetical protein E1B28_010974 [Marasmius oreades]|uniref:Uncharacterized protein n=1 Tax=Marasmius oreades TaxID=181124 RepID=A0A9P7RTV1_9AGAR|nr:uncharacterized protein E1B28_010974 [Marasmius oreades]KAG7089275.1 hypothetical protein E1B28_010974 [Marasmius oreades]